MLPILLIALLLGNQVMAPDWQHFTGIDLQFPLTCDSRANGYPTKATVEKLYDERDFQRACQLYLSSLPAVSFAEPTQAYFDRSWPLGDFERIP